MRVDIFKKWRELILLKQGIKTIHTLFFGVFFCQGKEKELLPTIPLSDNRQIPECTLINEWGPTTQFLLSQLGSLSPA